jgi:hypothetical protein
MSKDYKKLYEDVVALAKDGLTDGLYLSRSAKDVTEFLFPQLKKSENERISKKLIQLLQSGGRLPDEEHKQALSWLEKQSKIKLTHYDSAEKEKSDFVNGQFIQCRRSFNEFKEDESYLFEYIGDDTYIGKSDNVLDEEFYITPQQLFTLFTHQHCFSSESEQGNDENNEDCNEINNNIDYSSEIIGFLKNYVKDYGCTAMNSWVKWLESLKDKAQPQPKQYWGENKDERIRKFISNELVCLRANDEEGSDRYEELTDAIAWLEDAVTPTQQDWNYYKDKPVELWNEYIKGLANGIERGKNAVKNHPSDYKLEKQGKQKLLNNDKYQTVSVKTLDRLYESEKELERLKQGEQKPTEWSEEDEKIIKKIIESLQRYMPTDELSEEQEMIAWLKFIEPNHLKQSEVKNETKNKCPNYSEGYGCSTSPLKQCDTCPDYKLYNHITSLDRVTGHLKEEIEKEQLNMEKCAEYKDYDTANICQQRIIAYEKAIMIVNTLL